MEAIQSILNRLDHGGVAWVLTNRARRTTEVGEAFLRMGGFTREEMIGRKPRTLLHGPLTEGDRNMLLRSYLDNSLPVSVDLTNYRKDRSTYRVHLSVFPLPDAVGGHAFLAVEFEITKCGKLSLEQRAIVYRVAEAVTQYYN